MQTLSQIGEKKEGIIVDIDKSMSVFFRRRLCEIGLCFGTRVKVIKISGLKKSFLISFNGLTMTIQKEHANMIHVRQ